MFIIGIFVAVILHIYLFNRGFYSVSVDECARARHAYDLTFKNAFEAHVWPPFYKIVIGLFMKISNYNNMFIMPRIVCAVFGIGTVISLSLLSKELFESKLAAVITLFIAIFFPDRVVLSLAPLSEIIFIFFCY